jgi:hypothetical protein
MADTAIHCTREVYLPGKLLLTSVKIIQWSYSKHCCNGTAQYTGVTSTRAVYCVDVIVHARYCCSAVVVVALC